jgi:hypothetical protein
MTCAGSDNCAEQLTQQLLADLFGPMSPQVEPQAAEVPLKASVPKKPKKKMPKLDLEMVYPVDDQSATTTMPMPVQLAGGAPTLESPVTCTAEPLLAPFGWDASATNGVGVPIVPPTLMVPKKRRVQLPKRARKQVRLVIPDPMSMEVDPHAPTPMPKNPRPFVARATQTDDPSVVDNSVGNGHKLKPRKRLSKTVKPTKVKPEPKLAPKSCKPMSDHDSGIEGSDCDGLALVTVYICNH